MPGLALAAIAVLVVVLALLAGPRQGWQGEALPLWPWLLMFTVAGVAFWLIGRFRAPPTPRPPPSAQGGRKANDWLTAGIIGMLLLLILEKACTR